MMENIKHFLESSTIHGLSYISSSRKLTRVFWTFVVVAGFTGAFFIISESFYNWQKGPISTTLETLPISEITLPNVTVCPPKNLFLDLNFDIVQTENITFDNKTRRELIKYALNLIDGNTYQNIMANYEKIKDQNRYYNWYHGYTRLSSPYVSNQDGHLKCNIETSASSGSISTQNFTEKFDITKVDSLVIYRIYIHVPVHMKNYKDKKLIFIINKIDFTDKDDLYMKTWGSIKGDRTNLTISKSGPWIRRSKYEITFTRKIFDENMMNISLHMMPGFEISWNYDSYIEPDNDTRYRPKYDSKLNTVYVR